MDIAIELLDPRKIGKNYPELWTASGWSYMLDYNWIINEIEKHGAKNILDVGCGKSPLGKYIAGTVKAMYTGIDRAYGLDFKQYNPAENPDVIFWASSMEHNSPDEMQYLYRRSLEMLAPGGLFLSTITIAEQTGWFEPSVNTNLSIPDALRLFDCYLVRGNFEDVKQAYRDDDMIPSRYERRYGHWTTDDPAFIIAGVKAWK